MTERKAVQHLMDIATKNTRADRDTAVTALLRLSDPSISKEQVEKATRTPGPVEKLTGLYNSETKER